MANPIVLCDIGSRGGLHPRWKRLRPLLHPVLFDADPNIQGDCIAATTSTSRPFYYTPAKPGCSSLYKPNWQFIERFPNADRFNYTTTTVQTRPLPAVLERTQIHAPHLHPHFLKIDTQGAELEILHGAESLLASSVIGVEVETSFAPIYAGAPLFPETDSYLRSFGFELWDLNRYYWRDLEDGHMRCVFADALYFKRCGSPGVDSEIFTQLTQAYTHTLRESVAHAWQAVGRYLMPGSYDCDMQLGH